MRGGGGDKAGLLKEMGEGRGITAEGAPRSVTCLLCPRQSPCSGHSCDLRFGSGQEEGCVQAVYPEGAAVCMVGQLISITFLAVLLALH